MSIYAQLSISRDGFIAGPDPSLEDPLGQGGMQLHEWVFRLAAWRREHGLEGGETGPESAWVEEIPPRTGAYVMGRRMFSGGAGPWEDDPMGRGWWGDDPPYHRPVYVVTHHAREPLPMDGGTTFCFVTDGVEAAVAQAREAAGGRDVQIAGGADVVQQVAAAGLLDELTLHTAPVDLGGGTKLELPAELEEIERMDTPHTGHVRYRVTRR
jgi:dihydrofolate reductase